MHILQNNTKKKKFMQIVLSINFYSHCSIYFTCHCTSAKVNKVTKYLKKIFDLLL